MLKQFLVGFILLIIIALHVTTETFASTQLINDYYTRFINYNTLNGLSNNKITDIVQDQEGFMWIATANGLNKFDGFAFKHFVHNEKDSTSISNNYITALCIDAKGNLWVGTKNGLNLYQNSSESFIESTPNNKSINKISNKYIRALYNNHDEFLWIECADGILNKLDLSTGKVRYYKHNKIGYEYYDYHSITMDNNNDVWFGGRAIGPYVLDTLSEEMKLIKAGGEVKGKKRDQDIACIFQDSKERYWMSATDGFYRYDIDSNYFTKLLATSTFDIIEGENENLWLGTGGGLFKYNAATETFTQFKHNANDNQSIIHNHINCLLFDHAGNLWLGTGNGISLLAKRNNLFRHYRHIPENKASLSAENVSSFIKDHNNQVWIGTMDDGLNLWDRSKELFYSSADNPKLKLVSKRVSNLFLDKKNTLWIAQWSGKGFSKMNVNTFEVTNYSFDPNTFKRDWYSDFYEDKNNNFWVGFWGNSGIQFFNRTKEEFKPQNLNCFELPGDFPIKKMKIVGNKLWLSATTSTMHSFNVQTQNYHSYTPHLNNRIYEPQNDKMHISNAPFKYFNNCSSIIARNNTVYFATNGGLYKYTNHHFSEIQFTGNKNILNACADTNTNTLIFINSDHIYKLYQQNNKPIKLHTISDSSSLLFNKDIHAFYVTKSGQLLIGTNAGLFCYTENKDVISYYQNDHALKISKILSISEDKNENLWLLTNEGLIIEDKNKQILFNQRESNIFNHYIHCINYKQGFETMWLGTNKGLFKANLSDTSFTQIKGLTDIEIVHIEIYNDSTLLLGSNVGLVSYNRNNKKIEYHNQIGKHRLSSRLTSFIFEDKKGFIWVGTTNKGLNKIDTTNYHIKQYLDKNYAERRFYGEEASCICQLSDGQIWVGGEGINCYDEDKDAFIQFSSKDGLISDEILGIVQDEEDHVWISTSMGIVEMLPDLSILTVYGSDWGINTNKLSTALYKLDNSTILVGSNQGFYSFNPHKVSNTKHSSNFALSGFAIFDKTVKSDFTDHAPINLKYNQNFFTFNFTDFDFTNTTDRFVYKLVGVDKDWVKAKGNRASYTNISPGKYEFQLSSKYLNLNDSNNIKSLNVIITPPFWKTWWFSLIEILTVIIIAYYFYNQRIKRFKMREQHLELEQKLLRSEMNPHFVFNALIAIQSYIIKNKALEAGRYLSKFAKLMRLFLQNTRQKFIPLSQELETLVYYVDMQKLRFNNSFEFTLEYDNNMESDFIEIPPMMIQPFIENAIEHAFKGVQYIGEIKLSLEIISDDLIEVVVDDNGIGINQSDKKDGHESLATTITQERLAAFNKKGRYNLSIMDKSETGEANGTKITIRLPLKNMDE